MSATCSTTPATGTSWSARRARCSTAASARWRAAAPTCRRRCTGPGPAGCTTSRVDADAAHLAGRPSRRPWRTGRGRPGRACRWPTHPSSSPTAPSAPGRGRTRSRARATSPRSRPRPRRSTSRRDPARGWSRRSNPRRSHACWRNFGLSAPYWLCWTPSECSSQVSGRGRAAPYAGRHVHGVGLHPAEEVRPQVARRVVVRVGHDPLAELERRHVPAVRVAREHRLGGRASSRERGPVDRQREGAHVAGGERRGLGALHPEVELRCLLAGTAEADVVDGRLTGQRAVGAPTGAKVVPSAAASPAAPGPSRGRAATGAATRGTLATNDPIARVAWWSTVTAPGTATSGAGDRVEDPCAAARHDEHVVDAGRPQAGAGAPGARPPVAVEPSRSMAKAAIGTRGSSRVVQSTRQYVCAPLRPMPTRNRSAPLFRAGAGRIGVGAPRRGEAGHPAAARRRRGRRGRRRGSPSTPPLRRPAARCPRSGGSGPGRATRPAPVGPARPASPPGGHRRGDPTPPPRLVGAGARPAPRAARSRPDRRRSGRRPRSPRASSTRQDPSWTDAGLYPS